jgi:hypothetical protein
MYLQLACKVSKHDLSYSAIHNALYFLPLLVHQSNMYVEVS